MKNNDLSLFRRRQLGFVFQDFNLLPALTVEENMVLPLTLDEQPVSTMKQKVNKIAEQLDLTSILEKDHMKFQEDKRKELLSDER